MDTEWGRGGEVEGGFIFDRMSEPDMGNLKTDRVHYTH
jgi:hypothetical protein